MHGKSEEPTPLPGPLRPGDHAVDRAKRNARWYRSLGWNPLPSLRDRKSPALKSYSDFFTDPIPKEMLDQWSTPNIQLVCGCRFNLCVIDCDGAEAIREWHKMAARFGDTTRPWVVYTGGGGMHLYYAVPIGITAMPSRRLWASWDDATHSWRKHSAIELLADGKLVIAPPSIHVQTGRRYQWASRERGRKGPHKNRPEPRQSQTEGPPVLPRWVLSLAPPVAPAQPVVAPVQPPARLQTPWQPSGRDYKRTHVLDAITDKRAVAEGWGLRFAADTHNSAGWYAVHAVTRDKPGCEDRNPSASFHADTGVYMEMYDRQPWSLFDLGVLLRPELFPTWQDCCNYLGDVYIKGR